MHQCAGAGSVMQQAVMSRGPSEAASGESELDGGVRGGSCVACSIRIGAGKSEAVVPPEGVLMQPLSHAPLRDAQAWKLSCRKSTYINS